MWLDSASQHEQQLMVELGYRLIKSNCDDVLPFLEYLSNKHLPPTSVLAVKVDFPVRDKKVKDVNLLNLSFPLDWVNEYVQNKYFHINPIKAHIMLNPSLDLCIWSDVLNHVSSRDHVYFRERFEHYQFYEGVTFSEQHSNSLRTSFFSFSGYEIAHDAKSVRLLRYLTPFLDLAFCKPRETVEYAIERTCQERQIDAHQPVTDLSCREKDILLWAMYGKSNASIADSLYISERTVKFHMQNIMRKLNAKNRAQAVAIAIHAGLIAI